MFHIKNTSLSISGVSSGGSKGENAKEFFKTVTLGPK